MHRRVGFSTQRFNRRVEDWSREDWKHDAPTCARRARRFNRCVDDVSNPSGCVMHRRSSESHVGLTGLPDAEADRVRSWFSEDFGSFFRLRVLRAMSSRLYKHRSWPIGAYTTDNRTFSKQLHFHNVFTRSRITLSFFCSFSNSSTPRASQVRGDHCGFFP